MKLLFATDFSPAARNGLKIVKNLLLMETCDIYLIHVITSFWKEWLASGAYEKKARQRITSWQQEILKKENPEKLFIEKGNASEQIIHKANAINADLILLGAKAENEKNRYKTHTTIEAVVRHAKQSVYICNSPTIANVLCGFDGSLHAKVGLKKSIALCKKFHAKLNVVYVLPLFTDLPFAIDDAEARQLESEYKEKEIAKIKEFLKQFDFSGIEVKYSFPWGKPADVLLDTAEDFEHDLIVVGAKGHSLLEHVFLGSTAEKLLRYTPCSLLMIR